MVMEVEQMGLSTGEAGGYRMRDGDRKQDSCEEVQWGV